MSRALPSVILHWNVRGLISKCQEFKHSLFQLCPLIASIQETHFRDNDQYNFLVPGYSLLTNNINNEHRSGGVALYIADSIIHRSLPLKTSMNAVAAEVILNMTYFRYFSIHFVSNLVNQVILHQNEKLCKG